MQICLIRHGMTAGNKRRAYIGRTDESLCAEGIAAARAAAGTLPPCDVLAASPMLRCIQTASILYPDMEQRIVPGLRETDFGSFEGKNAADLSGDPAYQAWIDSGGKDPFPEGEAPAEASARCCSAFAALTAEVQAETLVIVAHGGTIMAIMERFALPKKDYYAWHTDPLHGYTAWWNGVYLTKAGQI